MMEQIRVVDIMDLIDLQKGRRRRAVSIKRRELEEKRTTLKNMERKQKMKKERQRTYAKKKHDTNLKFYRREKISRVKYIQPQHNQIKNAIEWQKFQSAIRFT